MEYNVGDIVRTKKQHPCGSKLWELTRVGVDFKMKCLGCGHVVVLERQKALKAITKKEEKKSSDSFWITRSFGSILNGTAIRERMLLRKQEALHPGVSETVTGFFEEDIVFFDTVKVLCIVPVIIKTGVGSA